MEVEWLFYYILIIYVWKYFSVHLGGLSSIVPVLIPILFLLFSILIDKIGLIDSKHSMNTHTLLHTHACMLPTYMREGGRDRERQREDSKFIFRSGDRTF